jgi:fucose 4-O-acetylase-like acetyltransferase
MCKTRLPFADWMKCLGITIIVYGHVSATTDHLIPPVYPKQVGVAFFVFVTGYLLARETRPRLEVLFNRLFEIYVIGIGMALLVSVINLIRIGKPSASNYEPFVLGCNVVFNNFPANPTTWFIGTYMHILLIWALLLRGRKIGPGVLVGTVLAEVVIRAVLAEFAGRFIAYMTFPNWMTVFLLGLYTGQRQADEAPSRSLPAYIAGLCGLLVAWPLILSPLVGRYTFPFMTLTTGHRAFDTALMSVSVSFVYIAFTWVTYQVTRRLESQAVVQFIARNSILVFIAHMPLYRTLERLLARWTVSYGVRVAVQMVACLLLLSVVSELIYRVIPLKSMRDGIWQRFGQPKVPGEPPQYPRAEREVARNA